MPNDNKYHNQSIQLTIWTTNAKCRYKVSNNISNYFSTCIKS